MSDKYKVKIPLLSKSNDQKVREGTNDYLLQIKRLSSYAFGIQHLFECLIFLFFFFLSCCLKVSNVSVVVGPLALEYTNSVRVRK